MPTRSRNVEYGTQLVSELPEQMPSVGPSPLEDQLQNIIDNSNYHAPRWARIGKYSSAEHVAAAGSAASILRRKHGDKPDVEGWRFETRRVDEGEASGLFAQYDPKAIVPGKAEENKVKYEQWRVRQAAAAKQRAKARKEKNGNGAKDDNWEYEAVAEDV